MSSINNEGEYMEVTISFVAVVLAALSTMIVGSLWYGKMGFYDTWAKLAKVKVDANFDNKKAAVLYGTAFLGSVVTAAVLAYFAEVTFKALGGDFVSVTLWVGFLGWLGFTAARIHMHDSFEGRRKKLTLINVSHEFVTIMVMALVIGLVG
ncbi:MAG: hypothetical protein JWM00_187 [Candidatus Saccharibacteria bacterium]|nr:hypothetical protein [Candidatus Saccharibacteria bacterium]